MDDTNNYHVNCHMLDNIEDIVTFNKEITAYIYNLEIIGSYSFNSVDVDVYKMPNNWDYFKNKLDYVPSFNGKYLYYTTCCNMAKVEPHLQKIGLEVF